MVRRNKFRLVVLYFDQGDQHKWLLLVYILKIFNVSFYKCLSVGTNDSRLSDSNVNGKPQYFHDNILLSMISLIF